MSRAAKFLILLEVAVCFLPTMLVLLFGLLIMPFQVRFLIEGELAALNAIVPVVMGVGGLLALFTVLRWLFLRPTKSFDRRITLVLMCLGAIPIVPYAVAGDTVLWKLAGVLPLMCTAHLAYLARDYLFKDPQGASHA
jgi:hypothetical protein